MYNSRRHTSRWMARAGTIALVIVTGIAVQLVGITPASAVNGLVKVPEASERNSISPKTVTAFCPVGKYVIGGGGWVRALTAADSNKVALTRLQPQHPVVPG